MDLFVFFRTGTPPGEKQVLAEVRVPHDGYLYGPYTAARIADALYLPTGWVCDIAHEHNR